MDCVCLSYLGSVTYSKFNTAYMTALKIAVALFIDGQISQAQSLLHCILDASPWSSRLLTFLLWRPQYFPSSLHLLLPFVLLLTIEKMHGSGRSDIVISAVDALDIHIALTSNDCDKYPGS